jgi:hypothetical protein
VRVAQPLLTAINSVHESHHEFGWLIIEAAEAVRAVALKYPSEVWQPILTRCDELGLGKSSQ